MWCGVLCVRVRVRARLGCGHTLTPLALLFRASSLAIARALSRPFGWKRVARCSAAPAARPDVGDAASANVVSALALLRATAPADKHSSSVRACVRASARGSAVRVDGGLTHTHAPTKRRRKNVAAATAAGRIAAAPLLLALPLGPTLLFPSLFGRGARGIFCCLFYRAPRTPHHARRPWHRGACLSLLPRLCCGRAAHSL